MSGNKLAGGAVNGKQADAQRSSVYLIGGDDEYLVTEEARKVIDNLVPVAEQVFGLDVVEGRVATADEAMRSLRKCLESLQTFGFLGGEKVVWLKDAEFLTAGAKDRSKDMQALIDSLVKLIEKKLPSGQTLVISMGKWDKRSALYKVCERQGKIVEFALPEKSNEACQQAADTAMQEFEQAGIGIDRETARILVERVGYDTRHVANEVQKLTLYVGNRCKVQLADVLALVPALRETAAWDLADTVGERDLPKALKVLRQLMFQKESHIGLAAGLEKRIAVLIILRTAMDRGWARLQKRGTWGQLIWEESPEAEKTLGSLGKDNPRTMHPFRAYKLAEQADRFTSRELLSARERVARAREQMVSTGLPPFLLLEMLLIRLIGSRGKVVAHR